MNLPEFLVAPCSRHSNRRLARSSIAVCLSIAVVCQASRAQLESVDRIVRLDPSAFSSLPAQVRIGLARLGCTVPQSAFAQAPENVIRGRFTRSSANEWATLCSMGGESEIVVFTGHSPVPIFRFAKRPDSGFVQEVEPGRMGFSRKIFAAPGAGRRAVIHDAFLEKASTVWRWQAGQWRATAGAD